MMRSLFSAVSGLKNHQTAMDVIGNNISNVNTVGFKSSSVVFSDIYSQTLSSAGAPTAAAGGTNAQQVGLGMTISAIKTNTTGGSLQSTGRTLDFSINGEGYFVVKAADGQDYYTRNGSLEVDAAGNLVTEDGGFVQGVMTAAADIGKGETDLTYLKNYTTANPLTGIVINPNLFTDYSIDSNGYVKAVVKSLTDGTIDLATNTPAPAVGDEVVLGRITLSTFINAGGLEKTGGSLYADSENSGAATVSYVNEGAAGALKGSSLEMSNVDLATELTNMIIMQRGFQANSRVITTSDTMLEELVNLKR